MIHNAKWFWVITELCLNYINKETGYANFRCYPTAEDAESFTNEVREEEQLYLKINSSDFDEFFSDQILDNKGITAKGQAYKYSQQEWKYFFSK